MKTETDALATRWTLIRKISNPDCDEQSWNDFYRLYEKLIYAVARKLGLSHEESQDAVQETMRSVCDKIREFVPDPARGSFRSWLLQMARWRITDQLRRRSKAGPAKASASGDTGRTATIERVPDPASLQLDVIWEEAWQKELFAKAVEKVKDEISPEQFQIFDFYVLRQMPVAKVRRSLGVTLAQIYLARHRTLKLIKKEVAAIKKRMGE
jgi:RNA polymerase sigma-70 factor (ECF subfamily)